MAKLFEQRIHAAPLGLGTKTSICSVVFDMAQCNCFKSMHALGVIQCRDWRTRNGRHRGLEEDGSSQQAPWHVGRGEIGNEGPGGGGLFERARCRYARSRAQRRA